MQMDIILQFHDLDNFQAFSPPIGPHRKPVKPQKKLLQKQAKGKKRMKAMGKVEVPQEAFMAVLKLDRNEM